MIKLFLDFIFPPFCLACKERSSTKHLCPACWELCAPPDPAERCRHCFGDLDQRGEICAQCRREPLLPIPRAFVFDAGAPIWSLRSDSVEGIAGFAVNQWLRLDWEVPDAIVPMPDPESRSLAKVFAACLERPFIPALREAGELMELKEGSFAEGLELLLIDAQNPIHRLQQAAIVLSEAFPKRSYLLSLCSK